ncbi:putative membrane protein YkvA [Dehalogenimonas formicexedens]|uniref:Putative membrane protein YkvA n=1 Tax=Dehalogenimonas formicexedens TaxID=1839801 RepID=A0A1P8F932_9CHLR|nr:YkvA family protein [Dehalogenimonas formicexedens]APV44932.1 putative membrane protein YkvA [Dehalogenimonas formicexedens]
MKFRQIRDNLKKHIRLYQALYRDKRTPKMAKIFLWLAIGYFFMPIDFIPDFIPVIGHLDDAIIIPGLIFVALRFIPKQLYLEHYREIFKA